MQMLYCFKVNRIWKKGISHVERLYATPFGFGFVNTFEYQEIEELHDSLHFLHTWKAYPAIRRLALQMQNRTCTVVDIMTQSTAEP